jgi:hypothetical protein
MSTRSLSIIRKVLQSILIVGMLVTLLGGSQAARAQKLNHFGNARQVRAVGQPDYVPGIVLVGFKSGSGLKTDLSGKITLSGTGSKTLDKDLADINAQSIKRVFSKPPKAGQSGHDLSLAYRIRLAANADVETAVKTLSADPSVEYAEPDYIARPADSPGNPLVRASSVFDNTPTSVVNDPLYDQQWGLAKINIEGAWAESMGASTVTIVILDSGIDLTHPDLAGHLWVNPGEIAGNSLDDDNDGVVDDVQGWNFVAGTNDVSDDSGHGTLVAGVAAAIANNGAGIAGVCPQCTIMPVKVMEGSTANYSDIAAGVLYAAQKGAKVINISLGGYANSNTLKNAIDIAVNTYGAVVVAGAGNDNLNQAFYPAAYDNTLAVAGTMSDDTKLDVSNYGSWVDVAAPAKDILSTASGGDWADNSGTSLAAPFVSGLAGLLAALHSGWNQAVIRSQIVHTADSIDSLNPSYAGLLGSGHIDAATALTVTPLPALSISATQVNGDPLGRPDPGADATLLVTLSNSWLDATGVQGTLSTSDPSVNVTTSSASFGDISSGSTGIDSPIFGFHVASSAGYDHPTAFNLHVSANNGSYVADLPLNLTTNSSDNNVSGTISGNITWTNDHTYIIIGNVGVAPGSSLTIQPGTTIKFNGNYNFSVGGTLIAAGTQSQPILFKSNTGGTWGNILFDDPSEDAVADGNGNYLSGSILRNVVIRNSSGGIRCTTATPYLSHVNLDGGGITCPLGSTPIWFMDSTITGNASFTGSGNALRNTITSGGLTISGTGVLDTNFVSKSLSLGSGTATNNTTSGGGLTVGGSSGGITNNSISGGNVSAGTGFSVTGNTITGSLTAGNSSTVDHNTVSNGITVGSDAMVTWNSVEGASGTGFAAGSSVTAQYNRLVGNLTGMTATTGTITHNLIANNTGVGLQVGAATVQYNTFTGNQGNTIVVQGGTPLAISYNNLETNTGTYDLYAGISSPATIPAQNNWWGTTNTSTINGRIFDYSDDYNKATAQYLPVATGPDQTAPGYVRGVTVLPDSTLGIQTGTFQIQFSRPMDKNITPKISSYSRKDVSWGTLPNMPDKRGWFGIAVGSNDKIYIMGGYDGVNSLNSVEEFDPFTNIWKTVKSMPYGNNDLAAVGSINGKIYAIGGEDQTCSALVQEYDPATNTWRIRSNMPTDRCRLAVVEGNNGKIYALGGADNDGHLLSTVDEYNPETDTWTSRAPMSIPRIGLGAAVVDGLIYAIGGTTQSDGFNIRTNAVEAYNPVTNTWTAKASMPTARDDLFAVSSSNGKIYAIGGSTGSETKIVEEYDPLNNIWKSTAGMSAARELFGAAAPSDGRIYVFGGLKNSGGYSFLDSVEKAYLPFQISSSHDPTWSSDSQFITHVDITSQIPKDTYHLVFSDAFDPDGMRIAPYSNATFTVDYAGSITDTTPPTKPVVRAFWGHNLTTISASWSSNDPQSPITLYRYGIGTAPGLRDVVAWTYTTATSVTRSNLNLTYGMIYYVSVAARNEGGLWSEVGISNHVILGPTIYLPIIPKH